MINSKSLSPFWAILLNLILPGFGYFYLGQVRRALTVLGLFYLILGFTTFYLGLSFIGFVIAVILIVGLYGYVLIDSFQRTRGGQALHFHLIQRKRILVPLLGFFLFVNSFFSEHKKIQSYVVPSVSMCPGVHTGDRLFVEKNASYVRGKVYVHALPSDPSVVFIKRLIGLPGDKISIRNGDLFINEKSVIVSKQPVGNQLKDGCSQRLLGELADISKTEAMIY